MWIWLVLLYGTIKGSREICKKKALETSPPVEVLLLYTLFSFILVLPDVINVTAMPARFYLLVALKAFVIFFAWILSFVAIRKLPLSMYGVLDLSRVLFATFLGMAVLGERIGAIHAMGLVLVCAGLALLRYPGKGAKEGPHISTPVVLIALLSCMLNSVSGLLDKILMKDISSSNLQFWYMLFLCIFYGLYALLMRSQVSIKRAVSNKWIWLLAIMFVVADRALFVANSYPDSKVTVMTLLKQSGAVVSILAGKFVFKEKNVGHKLVCAGVIIAGIVLGAVF